MKDALKTNISVVSSIEVDTWICLSIATYKVSYYAWLLLFYLEGNDILSLSSIANWR